MTRVSEFYQLDRTQPTLDFVDVDTRDDIRVFLDPRAILLLQSDWGEQCRELLHTYFAAVLSAIAADDTVRVRRLLSQLREPNETHLGFSSGPSRGHGLGRQSGEAIADALSGSRAARTGLLQDLEDTVLLVPGIGHDIVSDITTNVLRGPLIAYTRQQAELHDISTAQVASGPIWNPAKAIWEQGFVDLPAPHNRKLLLVPKALVRIKMDFDKDEYYGDYLIPMLQNEELSKAGSDLVEMLKRGPRVTKKAIKEKYGTNKDAVAALTATHREALDGYRRQKGEYVSPPLDHGRMADLTHSPPVDLPALLAAVRAVPPGRSHATAFHNAVEALLSALLYPALIDPEVEHQQHQGRKRVDIRYTNVARQGYFSWLIQHRIPSQHLFVECKNYTGDPANPELDQLGGRFSPLRGQVGLLVCRNFQNKQLFLERCRDTAHDRRGYCLALDDHDLAQLVADAEDERQNGHSVPVGFPLLKRRHDDLTS